MKEIVRDKGEQAVPASSIAEVQGKLTKCDEAFKQK